MISICIPIYNFNVTSLVTALEREIVSKKLNARIVLIDDCSLQSYKKLNHLTCQKHTYIELEKNIGRAKIRNLFLAHADAQYLLFLDCDALIVSPNFISNYIQTIETNNENVICGGRIYDPIKPKRKNRLSWKYGIKTESKSYTERLQNPNRSFMTNNFLIKREILNQIKFDERISKYGHEDTLFGYYLKQSNIKIDHINNPILNGDIEDNKTFLQKTELGIINLISILEYVNYDKSFIADVALLSFHKKLEEKKLIPIVLFLFIVFKPYLKFRLQKGFVNLNQFNFYKLGLLIENNKPLKKQPY